MPKPYVRARNAAFSRQAGRCYYCGCEMWLQSHLPLVDAYSLTRRQAQRFRCTAEHLKAQQDGGGHQRDNIVAACWGCNAMRHRPKCPERDPERYRHLVRCLMAKSQWHPAWARKATQVAQACLDVGHA